MSPKTKKNDDATALPDPYAPGSGSPGYRVLRYVLDLECKLAGNRLDGRARVSATALAELDRIELDLVGLTASKILVDARKPARFAHRNGRLVITPAAPLPEGSRFELDIRYGGNPRPRRGPWGEIGWEELEDGVLVAGQPTGAATWFPCNDHPSQKAPFEVRVSTDAGYRAVCNGTLVGHGRKASRESWHYVQEEPMATYLATLQIGRYGLESLAEAGTGTGHARHVAAEPLPRQDLAAPAPLVPAARRALARQPEMMAAFSEAFGPYPFGAYTVVVTEDELEIPLEAQGISILGRNHLAPGWEQQRLIAHELSHQWFGNSLTAGAWRDIWMHEGFACYAEWIWSEASGGPDCTARARDAWSMLSRLPQDLRVGDPGPEDMFDDRVYKRGALAVHALRASLGDHVFFAMLRAWTGSRRHGTVDHACFVRHVDDHAPEGFSAEAVLAPWLFSESLPPFPAAAPARP
ncbi:M1 family metallopeptidase [Zafaria sp. Z1313]|uniref:M1 family metallopeptidase n=1 Tax=unclassified Zafaria TaxID=2828765 RepID=UPI002E77F967|nr:M1 family metallopeptidase [Zafaria sp. J156]MEE1622004.1 M1 family metallopeptidase [Zafaria sp. J156]